MSRPKFAVGDRVYVNKRSYRDRPGVVTRFGLGEYEVRFDDGRDPVYTVVEAGRIERQEPASSQREQRSSTL